MDTILILSILPKYVLIMIIKHYIFADTEVLWILYLSLIAHTYFSWYAEDNFYLNAFCNPLVF